MATRTACAAEHANLPPDWTGEHVFSMGIGNRHRPLAADGTLELKSPHFSQIPILILALPHRTVKLRARMVPVEAWQRILIITV